MRKGTVWWHIAVIVVFAAIALTVFVENVRAVQVIGLLACGAGIGVSVMRILLLRKQAETKARG